MVSRPPQVDSIDETVTFIEALAAKVREDACHQRGVITDHENALEALQQERRQMGAEKREVGAEREEMGAEKKELEARIKELEAKIKEKDAMMKEMDANIKEVDAKITERQSKLETARREPGQFKVTASAQAIEKLLAFAGKVGEPATMPALAVLSV